MLDDRIASAPIENKFAKAPAGYCKVSIRKKRSL
jgi:hypothetical protein